MAAILWNWGSCCNCFRKGSKEAIMRCGVWSNSCLEISINVYHSSKVVSLQKIIEFILIIWNFIFSQNIYNQLFLHWWQVFCKWITKNGIWNLMQEHRKAFDRRMRKYDTVSNPYTRILSTASCSSMKWSCLTKGTLSPIVIANSFQNKVYTSQVTPIPTPSSSSSCSLIIWNLRSQSITLGSLRCLIKSAFIQDLWTVRSLNNQESERRKALLHNTLIVGWYLLDSSVLVEWSNCQWILHFLVPFQIWLDLKDGLGILPWFLPKREGLALHLEKFHFLHQELMRCCTFCPAHIWYNFHLPDKCRNTLKIKHACSHLLFSGKEVLQFHLLVPSVSTVTE